ncbi:ATP-binding protein [Microbacterium sp. NPDC056569]|uniref:ATP-binding protein n=1 Tax=Microbacterium sp. NPDC056569 TaxID=3345867 RepID=UPI00366BB7CE
MASDRTDVIRTPDQKLRVFVSSTLAELADERVAVRRAITTLGLAPVMFELGARPHPPQELYRAYLAQSDVFIGLYWESYGWVGPGMEISGLEDEFRRSGDKPRLLYLKAPAPARQAGLSALIDEIRAAGTDAYRTFATPRELGRLVRDDLALLLSERFIGMASRAADETPPSREPPRSTLPVTPTSFVGRDTDVEAITSLLSRPGVRLVTVTGPGGVGKTRTAVAAGQVLAVDASSTVFVPLASVTDPAHVLPRIAEAARAVVEGTRSMQDILIEHFADEPIVLILDNLEQVADAAPQLDRLLSHCPRLKILATSRVALRLRAEREYILQPLRSGTDGLSLDEAMELPAVQLFLDRAEALGRPIPTTERNVAAVLQICRRLDGLPLAIELAAARTRLLDPVAVLARLENALDALGSGPVDLPERQRGLRATVEWSVGLLNEAERRLLAELSVFVDGWTFSAAAAVGDIDEAAALDRLDTLTGHSLVGVDASGDEPRFRMLMTIREFAGELLTDDERAVAERRHAEFFAAAAQTPVVAERIQGWSDAMRRDEENLRAAVRWFFEHAPARLPHLFRTLSLFWEFQDRMPEGRAWITELQGRIDSQDLDVDSRAEVLFVAALTATETGDDAGGLTALDGLLQIVEVVGDAALRDLLYLAIAWALPIRDDFAGALEAATLAATGFAERSDPAAAFCPITMGTLQLALGDDDAARPHLAEAERIGTRIGSEWFSLTARTHLAIIEVRAGRPGAARQLIARALDDIDAARAVTPTLCFALGAFAQLSVADSRPELAAAALGAVDALRDRAGVLAWPTSRPIEAELRARVAAVLDRDQLAAAFAAGASLLPRDALAFMRSHIVER